MLKTGEIVLVPLVLGGGGGDSGGLGRLVAVVLSADVPSLLCVSVLEALDTALFVEPRLLVVPRAHRGPRANSLLWSPPSVVLVVEFGLDSVVLGVPG